MKKYLLRTLLTIVPLTATPLIAASCGSKTKKQKKANKIQNNLATVIKDKITNPNFSINYQQNSAVTNPTTATAIRAGLKNANQGLSDDDLTKISFSSATLVQNQSVSVKAIITVNGYVNKITLSVKMAFSPANVIKNKITHPNFNVVYQRNDSVTNPTTATAIKAALKSANPTLTNSDLSKITFSGGPLVVNTGVSVTATINDQSTTATIMLTVKMGLSPADLIKKKITNPTFNIPFGTNASVTNSATSTAIKTALKSANPTLTNSDLSKITFSGGPLVVGGLDNVTATINDQSTTATIVLKVTMDNQAWTQSPTSKGIPTNATIKAAPVKIGSVYYLSAVGSGLWTSTDGENWTRNNARGIPFNSNIQAAPVKIGSVYYLGTNGDGLYTSTDGENWTGSSGKGIPIDESLLVAPVKIGSVYYLSASTDGLYTSTDGENWNRINAAGIPTDAAIYKAPVKIGNTYYLSTLLNGLYTSTNGKTWNRNSAVGIPNNGNVVNVPVKSGNTYYLGTLQNGLYKSTNGINWIKITNILNISTEPVLIGGVWYLGTTGYGLFTSTNGTTWDRTNAVGIPTSAKIPKAPVKIGGVYYLGTDGNGLYTSTDGKNWNRANAVNIATNIIIWTAPVKIGNTYYLGTGANGLYTSKTTF